MQVIVGAAIVRDGRVLAARRTAPSSMAGGWEFPGGKVEPGESEHEALVRECREELGVDITVGSRLGDDVVTGGGGLLRVWWATIEGPDEPVPLQDHDDLRWLAPDELASVPWLPADWPLVHAAADALVEAVPLTGGRVGGAVLVGDTVRRPAGPWTPAVHDLLSWLNHADVPGVPTPLGLDAAGREVLRYLPGRTMGDAEPVPPEFRALPLVAEVGRWLRDFHAVSGTFPAEPRDWRRGRLARRPGGVVCHNDISPHNVVLDGRGRLVGVLDWDMAAPGHPLDDVAFAAWQLVLRHRLPVDEEAAGLVTLSRAYGAEASTVLDRVVPRLRGAVRVMRRGAAAGDPGFRRLLRTGIPEATEAGLEALQARLTPLAEAVAGR